MRDTRELCHRCGEKPVNSAGYSRRARSIGAGCRPARCTGHDRGEIAGLLRVGGPGSSAVRTRDDVVVLLDDPGPHSRTKTSPVGAMALASLIHVLSRRC